MSILSNVIARGLRASEPSASSVPTGTLFCVTDEGNIVERSNGTTWDAYSPAVSSGGGVVTPTTANVLQSSSIVIPQSLEIGGGFSYEVTNGGRLEITGDALQGWRLIKAITFNGNTTAGTAIVDVGNLDIYSALRVTIRNVTLTGATSLLVVVSTDGGVTFKTSSGDYVGISGGGVESNLTSLDFFSSSSATARSGDLTIDGTNLLAPKAARSTFFSTDSSMLKLVTTTSTINALRLKTGTTALMNGGTVYFFGR